jgi:hypothetical protein
MRLFRHAGDPFGSTAQAALVARPLREPAALGFAILGLADHRSRCNSNQNESGEGASSRGRCTTNKIDR